ncbi:MAG: hypothetical protein JNL79_37390 [Myxococcales bacterium]|nr:hypothetical protein [Myxococcales bacterium]
MLAETVASDDPVDLEVTARITACRTLSQKYGTTVSLTLDRTPYEVRIGDAGAYHDGVRAVCEARALVHLTAASSSSTFGTKIYWLHSLHQVRGQTVFTARDYDDARRKRRSWGFAATALFALPGSYIVYLGLRRPRPDSW